MRSSAGHRLSPLRPSPHNTARQLAGPRGMVVMSSPPAIAELSEHCTAFGRKRHHRSHQAITCDGSQPRAAAHYRDTQSVFQQRFIVKKNGFVITMKCFAGQVRHETQRQTLRMSHNCRDCDDRKYRD
ncbi:hypothetical protein NP284_18290 [Rhodopseudomonas pseudopalustris]